MDRHQAILREIAFAAAAMARSSDWRDGIDALLERLGQAVGVSRVYLFELEASDSGRLTHTCRHDWAAPDLERLANVPRYTNEQLEISDPVLDEWIVRRRRGEMIQGHTRELDGMLREDFEHQRIKSFLSIPIQLNGSWWGHLGFDDCVSERVWGTQEIHLLQTTAALIGASVAREDVARKLRGNEALRAAMLGVALDAIIMIDERGATLEFNPAAEAMFGWTRDEILGQQIGDVIVPTQLRAAHHAGFSRATRTRHLQHANRRSQLTAIRADGSEFPIELTLAQIERGGAMAHVAFIRDLTERHAAESRLRSLARERANLARFFSPQLVEQLVEIDTPLLVARNQRAAVLFVDMIGFSSFCSEHTPENVIAMLRDLLSLLSRAVFARQGTIDKFLGDGLLAVFGSPIAGPSDVTNAVRSALDILDAVERWNASSGRSDSDAIRVAVGIHYGDVIFGDVGTEKRLELTVVGHTVNTASRVEGFCRSLGAPLLVTGALMQALVDESGTSWADEFRDVGFHLLRGHTQPIQLFAPKESLLARVVAKPAGAERSAAEIGADEVPERASR